MEYTVFSQEFKHEDVIKLEQALVGLTIAHLPNGNIRVAGLIPDFTGQII